MARRQFKIPFAATGDTESIPNETQPDGSVSMQQGYGFDYQRDPQTDPLAKVFPRDVHNGLLNEITASIGEIQQQGYPIWVAAGAPYPINAVVRHNDVNWQSKIANNNDEPGVGPGAASWGNTTVTIPNGLITSGISGSSSNLKASATGTNATVTVTANSICLKNSANEQVVINSLSMSINSATVGENGLDTGVLSASTWYSVWVIWNGTTTAGLLSLSTTTPAMPSGYTHKARVGWARTDATANKYPLSFIQAGRRVRYKVAPGSNVTEYPAIASGVAGTLSETAFAGVAVSTAGTVPSTAAMVCVNPVNVNPGFFAAVAPRADGFGGWDAVNAPPIVSQSEGYNGDGEIFLESANIYWASNGGGSLLRMVGWEDNL